MTLTFGTNSFAVADNVVVLFIGLREESLESIKKQIQYC
jgi:hypothetical protein